MLDDDGGGDDDKDDILLDDIDKGSGLIVSVGLMSGYNSLSLSTAWIYGEGVYVGRGEGTCE
jgi:hypothetical protein